MRAGGVMRSAEGFRDIYNSVVIGVECCFIIHGTCIDRLRQLLFGEQVGFLSLITFGKCY